MLPIRRPELADELRTELDRWQHHVNENSLDRLAPESPTSQQSSALSDWEDDIDNEKSVGKSAWKMFSKLVPQTKSRLLRTLQTMSHGKCMYCETGDANQIEHYWPKSPHRTHNQGRGTHERMFQWDNLLLSCATCNDWGHKGAHFAWRDDQPLLLNPCQDEPLGYFRFDLSYGNTMSTGWVDPIGGTSPLDQERAEYTIHRLKLNTRSSLRQGRSQVYRELRTWIELLLDHIDDPDYELPTGYTVRRRFREMLADERPYLAIIRQYLYENPDVRERLIELMPELENAIPIQGRLMLRVL